jgi:hypothetical protein
MRLGRTGKGFLGILLVIDESREHLETQGLGALFGLKEIHLTTQEGLQDLHQYAQVLTFILDHRNRR